MKNANFGMRIAARFSLLLSAFFSGEEGGLKEKQEHGLWPLRLKGLLLQEWRQKIRKFSDVEDLHKRQARTTIKHEQDEELLML